MAKTSKKLSEDTASEGGPIAPSDGSTQANGTIKPAKQPKVKSVTRTPKKTPPTAKVSDKSSRPTKAKGAPAAKSKRIREMAKPESFTDDDIRIRAYFISEHRTREGIPGSSADDWLEARRQLQAEA